MKKTFTILALTFLIAKSLNAQYIYFNKRIDITGDWDVCRGIVPFNNGYFVAGGHGPGETIYLSFLNSIGGLQWTQNFSETGYNYFLGLSGALFQTKDNYIAICGSRVLYYSYCILIKLDSLGNKKWEKEYQIPEYSSLFNNGNNTKDFGYILTGSAMETGIRNKYLLLKTDSLGNQEWYKTYTDNDLNRTYEGNCVLQTPDKGYCLAGYGGYWSNPYTEYSGIAEIIKTDSLGNQQWKKTYGNPVNCNFGTILTLSNDSCIIGSYSLAYSSDMLSNRQLYVTKIGLNGIEQWNKKIGLADPNKWTSWIQTLDDGKIILCGSNAVKDTNSKVIGWLFKLDSNGDSLWYKEYANIQGENDGNELWQVTPTPDSGFAASGNLFPNSTGGTQDIWVFKTDSMGCLVPHCNVGISEFNSHLGAQMFIYPNPFYEAFAINYYIPKENKKSIFMLHDLFGKLVYQVELNTSINQLQLVTNKLQSGVYLASLIVDGVLVFSEKVIKE